MRGPEGLLAGIGLWGIIDMYMIEDLYTTSTLSLKEREIENWS